MLTTKFKVLATLMKKTCENICKKKKRKMLLFPQCCLPFQTQISLFECYVIGQVYNYVFWFKFKFKHIYFTSIEKQVITAYTNLSQFCFLGTTPVLAPNVWANEKISKLTPVPGNRTRDINIARPTLYLTTTDTRHSFG